MASTSDEHPPTLTPMLHTVPFHSHVLVLVVVFFSSFFSARSPLILLTLRFLLNGRVSMESPAELEEATGSWIGMSNPDREMDPEGKGFNRP